MRRRVRRVRELTMAQDRGDRVGLGWRPELAAGIFDALDRIDVLELLADDHLGAGRRARRALNAIARKVPMHVHSVGLGLAGAEPVDARALDRLARLVGDVAPEAWSEHLAFVRAGGIEIGHLAAPPRTEASVAAAARNLRAAANAVGAMPLMENIATLMDPPCSTLGEPAWVAGILAASGCGLLLDVHNLHANATNFRFDPLAYLAGIPLERIGCIHIAGGSFIAAPAGDRQYLLDDHLHDVDAPVYALLAEIAARAPQPLTVVLERDGAYPPMPALLDQLDRARAALAAGRARREAMRETEARHAG
jgi:uncharacterized protein (UPF0276 family)